LKVLHVTPAFAPAHTYGGAVAAIQDLCVGLEQAGCSIKVLTTNGNGDEQVLDVETDDEVTVTPRLQIRYCRRIRRQAVSPSLFARVSEYVRWADVVHLHGVYSFPTIPTLAACRIFAKPLVWTPHGVLQRWEGSTRTTLKAVWEWICRTMAPGKVILHTTSEQEARASQRRFPGAEVVVIPFGHHVPEQISHDEDARTLRLLFLGRLHPKKGIENLLDACTMLNRLLDRPWSLIIAGDGDRRYVQSLRARIRSLGIGEQVAVVGEVLGKKKDALFSHADAVVVPSYTENFGVVVAEALSHAIPVIASTGTPWQRVEEVGCGLWVDNTPPSLSSAIQRMSYSPLCEMGQRGREWLKREFRWDMAADAIVKCYERAIATSVNEIPSLGCGRSSSPGLMQKD
jgi:glycosyltransferase involved in cell wall biosynthesis